jgi:DNA-binding transcriptional MocR family regulator
MKDRIAEEIKKKALNNRIPCPVARKIAQELSVSFKEVGRAANELKIKITDCELGCF